MVVAMRYVLILMTNMVLYYSVLSTCLGVQFELFPVTATAVTSIVKKVSFAPTTHPPLAFLLLFEFETNITLDMKKNYHTILTGQPSI